MNTAAFRSIRLAASLLVGAVFVSALVLALFLASAPPAHAATRCVHPSGVGGCFTTIQAAVTAADPGDTINIAAGTYAEHVLVGSKALTFSGAGADSTFVDGSNTGRVFSVTATSATFSNLTVQNGRVISESGAGIYVSGTLTLTNVNVLSNTVNAGATISQGGGGVRVRGELRVTGGRFENNLATATGTTNIEGGAIFSNAPDSSHPNVIISGTTFFSNTAKYGGGISLAASGWLTNTQFISNTAISRGGGVYQNATGKLLTLSGGRFERNSAGPTSPRGGGLYFGGSAVVSGTEFISNTCGGTGGGARINEAVTLTDAEFTGNLATGAGSHGGGLYAGAGLTVTNGMFTDNSSSGSGGGVYVYNLGGGATVTGTRFISNSAGSDGGGMSVALTSTVSSTQFYSNSASLRGGGLFTEKSLTLTDADFLSNTAFSSGGGLYIILTATVTGGVFLNNGANSSGGGLYVAMGATLTGTQFISNTAGGDGGGLWVNRTATLTGTQFISNTAGGIGGGLYNFSNSRMLTLVDTEFRANTAVTSGGGVYAMGPATIVGAQFTGNSATAATSSGGGLYAYYYLVMTDTQLIRNSAADGGGIYVFGGTNPATSSLVNVLLAANMASTNGAALYLYPSNSSGNPGARTATIVHTTIASPTVGASQAIFVGKPLTLYIPTVNITNTIIANYATGISVTAGAVVNSDYNYFNNAPTSVVIGSHSISGAEHYLLFANAAGDNYRPALGSPAPTHGLNLGVTADLDGATRSNPPTIGAYEGTPYPNVWLSKAVTPTTDVPYHGVVTYTLDLNNTGSLTNTVRLTDTLPAGVTFGAWVTEPAGVIRAGNAITWTGVITDLEAAITLVFTATHTGNYGDVIANTAWFSGSAQTGSEAASFSVEAALCSDAIEVQNTGDSGAGSLRQALADVCPGGTITFAPALTASGPATITLTSGQLTVAKNVTLTGSGANLLAVSGNNASRVFYVNSAVAAAISGLTICDGNSSGDGGGIYSAGALTLATSRVVSNAAANGGGLYQGGSGAGRVVNTLFARNTAVTNGAAMYLGSSGTVDVLHNTIANPTVGAGAAIYVGGGTLNPAARPRWRPPSGAAIYVGGGTLNITNTVVAGYPIGIQQAAGTVTAWNTLFNGNTADTSGTVTNNAPVTGDPLFVDPANGDYHLGADSAAVDAGVDAGITTDYDGDARPLGAGYDIGYDEVLQQCSLSTGVDYTFGSPAVTLNFSNLGNISCAGGVYFPRAQPYATGTVGHGVGGDHFWQLAARTSGGAVATGFTALLTAPTGGVSNPALCFYSGEGVYGWDCGGTVDGGNISRTITHFSDYAVGSKVGANAVTLQTLGASPVGGANALLGLALITCLIAGVGAWRFTRRILPQR